MKLLVIGGTRFVGRYIAASAIARGHELTLFHRGTTNQGLFDVEEILGDRDGETDRLSGRRWDAVIDTCGYYPRVVEQSADMLETATDRYCFISSISVYKEGQQGLQGENAEVIRLDPPPAKEEITAESYGAFKVLCEDAISNAFGDARALIVRPGLIVGPHDPSDRFTYWIDRFSRNECVLIPDRAEQPVQVIDARDLGEFVVKAVEANASGIFNTTGPAFPINMGALWKTCKANCGASPDEVVVSDPFLKENAIQEWVDLPLVMPTDADPFQFSSAKAVGNGLTYRSLEDTVRDTAEWHRSRGEIELKTGLTRDRERALLEKWGNG